MKERGIGGMSESEFNAWMDGYFRDKTPQALRDLLIEEDSRLAAYFTENNIVSNSDPIVNPLTSSVLAWLQTDRPPGYISIPDCPEASNFEAFLFALH